MSNVMTGAEIDATTGEPATPLMPSSLKGAKLKRRLIVHGSQLAVLVLIFGGWQWAASTGHLDPALFGKPSAVIERLKTWIQDGTSVGSLGDQIKVTLEEAIIGFVIGVTLGIVCGIALGRVRFLSDVFGPFIKVLNSIPRIVLGSIFVIMFGLGLESKVLLVIVLVFFGVFFNAFQGTREVDRNFIANARILGASKWQVTRQVVLPSALTWILASLHISFGFALIGAIVGEYLGAEQGLGVLIKSAQNTFDANGVWAAMLIMAVIALIAEFLITRLENVLLRWRPSQLTDAGL